MDIHKLATIVHRNALELPLELAPMLPLQTVYRLSHAYKLTLGRNIYSQDVNKRECAFTPYKDGLYYSDCSSSVRLAYKRAGIGLSNIGGNTVAQIQNKAGVRIDCGIKNGIPTDIGKLRVGDLLLFAGNDEGRAYAEYVGHVEMIYKIVDNVATLCGHGSGNPKTTEMAAYCRTRQATKASTKRGNRGLICVKRFIPDDASVPDSPDTEGKVPLGARTLNYGKTGDDVRALQTELKRLGFFKGTPLGNFLDLTKDAVMAFQRAHALAVDGVYGPKSHAMLQSVMGGQAQPVQPSAPQRVLIAGGNCWVRKSPVTGTKIDVAYKGQEYLYLGETKDGWPKVRVGEKDGYVSPKYAKIK